MSTLGQVENSDLVQAKAYYQQMGITPKMILQVT